MSPSPDESPNVQVTALLNVLGPLVRREGVAEGQEDAPDAPQDNPKDEQFQEEQRLVARIIPQFGSSNLDAHYKVCHDS